MTYHYETLSPDRFQHLCQALIAAVHPNVQCLPVGQPDGGRDAFEFTRVSDSKPLEMLVFQVKFSRNPNMGSERDFIHSIVKSELPKIKRLTKDGVSAYYLMTNVKGTSHHDAGSIDRVNKTLTDAIGVPAYCWWRDDLDRRIDNHSDIKWSYSEIIRGIDFMQALIEGTITEEGRRRHDALRAFLAAQHRDDEQVKFKQVELQNRLLDLFVDMPISLSRSLRTERNLHRDFFPSEEEEYVEVENRYVRRREKPPAVAALLSSRGRYRRVVLEGAPGQGKSTITQYLCQVHRMRLLQKNNEVKRIEKEHRTSEIRIPFRVDLRDYATWLSGKNPFTPDPSTPLPAEANPALESFLAAQVRQHSGGYEFRVADLASLARTSHLLIALDGFDEVADIPTRQLVVEELSRAATRLEATSKSVQIIVTSRPAAFANSPGFPEKEWHHLELLSMTLPQVNSYAQKWLDARRLTVKEQTEFKHVLGQKLDQPHMRDLSRNPMQLAILLTLIHTRGLSLPDKRTALYDNYMELFFSREAEKSPVVREHRELLIDLHRFLAWTLHSEAEEGKSGGSIQEDQLKNLLRRYLAREGHKASLVDELFTGMVERVVALVSRVQGTFEFEVQPLREYFAARHLYETAPYSPPGSEKRGTKPERFAALAANFYWLNVTRFFAGCFSRGELASLADEIEELSNRDAFRFISHPRIGANAAG